MMSNMRVGTLSLAKCATLAGLLVSTPIFATVARAQSYSVLYSFQCGPNDGENPFSSLVLDAAGNLYGSTSGGGPNNWGIVFQLSPSGSEAILHYFAGPPTGGGAPTYTSLLRDSSGNLYGTTPNGGAQNLGVVFRLSSNDTETILHSFGGGGDGSFSYGGLASDAAGNLYGATEEGGSGYGTVFQLSRTRKEIQLYNFFPGVDGTHPIGGLVRDSAGNLYGTTSNGGIGYGTVFELSASGNQTVLHTFTGGDGANPFGGLVRDSAGNLYGTTTARGVANAGTAFRVSAADQFTVMHRFTGSPDGAVPVAGLIRDPAGNSYGVTFYGGTGTCSNGTILGCGTIFEIAKTGKETILYSFTGALDGSGPGGGLVRDTAGNLYGTASGGGTYGCGTVFKYTP